MLEKLPPLSSKKSPAIAFFAGCIFGCIGVGIYLGSFQDFLIPLVVFIVLAIVGVGLGALPGWLFAGFWGMMRVIDSNSRLGH